MQGVKRARETCHHAAPLGFIEALRDGTVRAQVMIVGDAIQFLSPPGLSRPLSRTGAHVTGAAARSGAQAPFPRPYACMVRGVELIESVHE